MLVPRPACSWSNARTASAISRRPPYPTATFTIRPVRSAVASWASFKRPRGGVGEQIEGSDRVDQPAAASRQLAHGVFDDPEERCELLLGPIQVVGRQQPQGDDVDVQFGAPAEELVDLRGALAMARRDADPECLCPATVAVEDDPDMARYAVGRQLSGDPALVGPVEEAAHIHRWDGTSHRARPCQPRRGQSVRR